MINWWDPFPNEFRQILQDGKFDQSKLKTNRK